MEYWGWDYIFGRWKEQWSPSLYVGNLDRNVRDSDLYDLFSQSAHVVSVHLCRDPSTNVSFGYGYVFFTNRQDDDKGKSRRFGYVNFVHSDDAANAVEALNGKRIGYYKEWFVAKSRKKYEMASATKQRLKNIVERSQSSNNLCVMNLRKHVTDQNLSDFFSSYGTITSCKVMRDTNGVSKGSGFVAFSKPEEVSKAMEGINEDQKTSLRGCSYSTLANATPQQQRTVSECFSLPYRSARDMSALLPSNRYDSRIHSYRGNNGGREDCRPAAASTICEWLTILPKPISDCEQTRERFDSLKGVRD